jgi:prevent-host-death family protein
VPNARRTFDSQAKLSDILAAVGPGKEVVITRGGRPIARVVPVTSRKRILGELRGTFVLKPGWDEPVTEDELSGSS